MVHYSSIRSGLWRLLSFKDEQHLGQLIILQSTVLNSETRTDFVTDVTVSFQCIKCLLVLSNKDWKHEAHGHRVLCHNPERHWKLLVSLVYDCRRKPRIKETVSVCSIRLPAHLFLLWNQITAAPLLGETISTPWDGGVIEEVKGESKLINLTDRAPLFVSWFKGFILGLKMNIQRITC